MEFVFWFQFYTVIAVFLGFLRMFRYSEFQTAEPGMQLAVMMLITLFYTPPIYAAFWFIPELVIGG